MSEKDQKDRETIAKKVIADITADSAGDNRNALKRLASNSDKSLKYSGVLYKVNQTKIKYQKAETKKYSELYKKYKYDSQYLLTKKADVESFIFRDPEYVEVKGKLMEFENLSALLTNVVRIYMDKEYSERTLAKAYIEGVE